MRNFIILASATALSACGGAGPQSAGDTPATSGGSGSTTTGTFVNPTELKSYDAIGAAQHYEYQTRSNGSGQYGQLYAGDANSARDSGITVAYNPRDAIFEVTISRPNADVSTDVNRFQDPLHRTDFGGLREPQAGVPQLPVASAIQYLQSGSSTGTPGTDGYKSQTQTFFYQKPGTTTQYVTYAGYVRNILSTSAQTAPDGTAYLEDSYSRDRAVFAWGERTGNSAVPITGTGTYSGNMLATMVFNPMTDTDPSASSYLQWIVGNNSTTVDFAKMTVTTALTGTVMAPQTDRFTNGNYLLDAGTTFTANATGKVDLVNKGGFSGSVTDAKFVTPGGAEFVVAIAGSSIDGAFFGPKAEEIGGGFRIVGGKPDERIDILGTYTGKK